MTRPRTVYLLSLLLLTGVALMARGEEEAPAPVADAPPAEVVAEAIREAREDQARFHMVVHCTDQDGPRRLEVFPSGVAIWNGRTQVSLGGPVRRALLDTLVERGFPSMDTNYGGKPKPAEAGEPRPAAPAGEPGAESDAEPGVEPDAEPGAGAGGSGSAAAAGEGDGYGPLRVRCQVTFQRGGVAKTSIQQVDGAQSPAVPELAAVLLDRVEPLVATGVGAEDLEDGLAKVAAGTLAPEAFRLRFVQLPGGGGALAEQQAGNIVLIDQGTSTRRSYRPGRELGEPEVRSLSPDELSALAKRLQEAGLPSLPNNLRYDQQVELEVTVLGHDKAVLARSFAGRETDPEVQKRFEALVEDLRERLLGSTAP